MSEFQKDELSLEETNKLRIQLGLKPLAPGSDDDVAATDGKKDKAVSSDDDDDPLKNQDEKAAKNYAAYQDAMRRKREEDETRDRIARAQNRRELNRKLQGRTLGETDAKEGEGSADGAVNAKKWLKAQRKKAKENEERLRREEEEAQAAASAAATSRYGSEDLRGLKVGHDIDEFDLEEGGEARVLTLRDSRILDNEDDELMDSTLDQTERDRIMAERKKGAKKYSGLDDDEFDASQVGRRRGVLSKYDVDIEQDGITRDADVGFRLGGEVKSRSERDEEKRRESERMLNRTLLNLDYSKNEEMSDYLKEGDVGFKKPKTKKRRATARIRLDEDDDQASGAPGLGADTNMADLQAPSASTSNTVPTRRHVSESTDLIDDDDLAISLAKARRKQARKTFQKMTPEMIARNLAEQRAAEEADRAAAAADNLPAQPDAVEGIDIKEEPSDGLDAESGGLTFDETSEFVRSIQAARETSPESSQRVRRRATSSTVKAEGDTPIKEEVTSPQRPYGEFAADQLPQDSLARSTAVKEEDSDEEMGFTEDATFNAAPTTAAGEFADAANVAVVEPLVSGGLASTLSILRNQGLISETTPEQQEHERQQKEYDAWLAKRRMEDRLREAELAASKAQGSAKDQATREYENRMREMEDARRAQDRFRDYKPDIDIKYHDEYGRVLDNHEAWKRLSHTFHGKAPGKKKQEKRLQKIEDERRREKMLAGDTPTGMSKAFAERAERSGQAHMVLGVGARNNAPQDVDLLGPSTVSRGTSGTRDKGKSRQAADGDRDAHPNGSYGRATPAIGGDARSGLESDATGVTSMIPRSTIPRSKAGFAPVRRQVPVNGGGNGLGADSPSGSPSPAQPSKFKLAFAKRPAPSQASNAAPASKQSKGEGRSGDGE